VVAVDENAGECEEMLEQEEAPVDLDEAEDLVTSVS